MLKQAYCIKCKSKRLVVKGILDYAYKGRPIERGRCEVCDSKVIRFMTSEEKRVLRENSQYE